MQFKQGMGWKACYDEEKNICTAQRSQRGYYQLCEISKESFDALDEDNAVDIIRSGRELFESDDDYYTMPYYMVKDDNYASLAPWADAMRRATLTDEYHKKRQEQEELSKADQKLAPFYKAILDADRAPIVVCDLSHEIIYMNPAAIEKYSRWGGADLIGKSLLDCHNERSRELIDKVLDWFLLSNGNNIVHTFYNEKENKDVYMVALRSEKGGLMGYYEKHEYRDKDTMPMYDIG